VYEALLGSLRTVDANPALDGRARLSAAVSAAAAVWNPEQVRCVHTRWPRALAASAEGAARAQADPRMRGRIRRRRRMSMSRRAARALASPRAP
jgi:hypothetical protein